MKLGRQEPGTGARELTAATTILAGRFFTHEYRRSIGHNGLVYHVDGQIYPTAGK